MVGAVQGLWAHPKGKRVHLLKVCARTSSSENVRALPPQSVCEHLILQSMPMHRLNLCSPCSSTRVARVSSKPSAVIHISQSSPTCMHST